MNLKRLARPVIERLVAVGLLDEIGVHKALKASSLTQWLEDHGIDAPEGIATELPAALIEKIIAAAGLIMNQEWWMDVGASIREEIAGIIERGITEGKTYAQVRQDLEVSSAKFSRARALRIARTEVNAAIQSGKHELLQELASETGGLMGGKEWMAILDEKTRATHWAADGQIVAVDKPFTVGGHPAQFPGDPSLPVEERVNCRCQVLSATLAEALGESLPGVPPFPAAADTSLASK